MLANWLDNLNERGRMVVFGVVVLALAVLCGWVLFSGPDDNPVPEAPAPVEETIPTTPTAGGAEGTGTGEQPAATGGLLIDADPPVDTEEVTRLARHAADFVIAYQSFRYDEDMKAKMTRVRAMLSNDSQVSPELSIPDGPMLATLRTDRTVVEVAPSAAQVTLIAPTIVSFKVTAEVATTAADTTTRATNAYAVTLYRDKSSWGVGSFNVGTDAGE